MSRPKPGKIHLQKRPTANARPLIQMRTHLPALLASLLLTIAPPSTAEELVVTYMTQVIPATGADDHQKLRVAIYSALE